MPVIDHTVRYAPSLFGGDQMIQGSEAMYSPQNVIADPVHEFPANDCGNVWKGVIDSVHKEEMEGRNGEHS